MDAEFVAAARSWIGVPWVHQGRSRAGVDCIGLVVMAMRDCGLDVVVEANYGMIQRYWAGKPLLMRYCDRVGSHGAGIIALYMTTSILHVGVLTGEGTVVHAYGPSGRVVESGMNFKPVQYWRPKWPC